MKDLALSDSGRISLKETFSTTLRTGNNTHFTSSPPPLLNEGSASCSHSFLMLDPSAACFLRPIRLYRLPYLCKTTPILHKGARPVVLQCWQWCWLWSPTRCCADIKNEEMVGRNDPCGGAVTPPWDGIVAKALCAECGRRHASRRRYLHRRNLLQCASMDSSVQSRLWDMALDFVTHRPRGSGRPISRSGMHTRGGRY